jgi:hypothetical protein
MGKTIGRIHERTIETILIDKSCASDEFEAFSTAHMHDGRLWNS